jgi:hypothetical protein
MLLDVKQVYDYLNGNIGLNQLYKLMSTGQIISHKLDGRKKMVTTKTHVDNYVKNIFRSDIETNAKINKVINQNI